jgi:integrase
MPTRWENKTAPVPGHVLQPLLASALYVVTMLGPVAVEVAAELRKTALDGSRKPERPGEHAPQKDPLTRFPPVLAQHRQDRAPFGEAAATADVLASFGRRALTVTAVGGEALPWTIPLHRAEAEKLIGIVRTAVIIVILAVTGMRSSEVMELQVGARQPPKEAGTGMARYRIASNVIKGQPLGGTWDEWVVIEPVYQAVGLAERLHDDPRDGALLFGRFGSRSRYQVFRDWVNGPAGQRLGLAPIPGGLVTPRMLRRTLAIELAYRPGGLLAAKLHLKHISVATTEGRYPALAALRPSS